MDAVTRTESVPPSWRTVTVLGVALAFGASSGPLIILAGGIIGQRLAPSPLLVTLPITALVLGVAAATVPAALLMSRIGRRSGFMIGAAISAVGALLAAAATSAASFTGFIAATFVMGAAGAFAQQYRFAAAESVDAKHTGRAISLVMLGGIVAGVIGPEIGRLGRYWLATEFSGAFVIAAIVQTGVVVLLAAMRRPRTATAAAGAGARVPIGVLLRRPGLAIAIVAAASAFATMSFLMTATPISMHTVDGHSLDVTARVIQSHVIAMYAPSLVTGWLVDRLGVNRMMIAGSITLLGCTAVSASSHDAGAYWLGLVLLGIGWNLLFVGATVLLTRSYVPAERFRAQAVNDLAVFGSQATASLASGAVLYQFGWLTMNVAAAVVLIVTLVLVVVARARESQPVHVDPEMSS
jgi:predicted MFS family arabinose efflux permease